MIHLTQSLQQWLWENHRDVMGLIMLGHMELYTPEMNAAYLEWCKTPEGAKYLKGGEKYRSPDPEWERDVLVERIELEAQLNAVVEVIEGAMKRHVYFLTKAPEETPPLPEDGRIADIRHSACRYIPLIDRMAWGLAIYSRELSDIEMETYGLIHAPRD